MESVKITKATDGKFDLRPIINFFTHAKSGDYLVEVKKVRRTRTLDQNGWLFGCIYPLLLNAMQSEGWEFTTVEEVHEFFKALFCRHKYLNKFTGEVVEINDSTANMNTVVFSEYCEQLRNYGREFLNIDIPDPIKD